MNFETLIKENGLENIYTTRNVRAQVNQAMANSELVMYYETCRVHSFVLMQRAGTNTRNKILTSSLILTTITTHLTS
tara:strand:- start:926 stop:1156 length:231 start_codon:yes stop_codon:yes gene_type:complete